MRIRATGPSVSGVCRAGLPTAAGVVVLGALVSLVACVRPVVPVAQPKPGPAAVARVEPTVEPVIAATEPGVWVEVAPAFVPGKVVVYKAVFADHRGVWRCAIGRCEYFDAKGERGAAWPLACDASRQLAAAADGGFVAQVCGTDLVVIETGTTQRRTQPLSEPDVYALVVDTGGTVTLTAIGAGNEVIVLRFPSTGLAPRRTVVVNGSSASIEPGTGQLLAYTSGNGPREAAWFDATPPIEVTADGLWMVNGEHLWLSKSTGGYLRQRARDSEPVRGAPKGGMPPCGIGLDVRPWGADGLLFSYERAVLLVDAQLEQVGLVPLPQGTMQLVGFPAVERGLASDVVTSPDGRQLYVVLPDASVLRWTGPLQNPRESCR